MYNQYNYRNNSRVIYEEIRSVETVNLPFKACFVMIFVQDIANGRRIA